MMTNLKLSFDVDGTILRESIQEYAKFLVDSGYDVWITTRRYDNISLYTDDFIKSYGIQNLEIEHYKLFDIAKKVGIPNNKIRFTNMKDKWLYFSPNEGFLWHLDDDQFELSGINKYCNTVGISCVNGSNWRHKCDRLIKKKLNEEI